MIIDIKDTAYLIVSNVRVEKGWILSENNGMYTVKLSSTGGAIRVSESRLYSTQEKAEAMIKWRNENIAVPMEPNGQKRTIPQPKKEVFHSPHYYGW